MAVYRISGVWKGANDVITHYAVHQVEGNTCSRAVKKLKSETIALVEMPANTATTRIWNYKSAGWVIGENVEVVNGKSGKYLRSNPNNRETDNLGHLIDFDWIA